ncbi:MAG: hypothetical protein K9M07_00840 [Simkaniaceae bacterium]|nr:hypothetical protein [Simkaniaceae bacterium]
MAAIAATSKEPTSLVPFVNHDFYNALFGTAQAVAQLGYCAVQSGAIVQIARIMQIAITAIASLPLSYMIKLIPGSSLVTREIRPLTNIIQPSELNLLPRSAELAATLATAVALTYFLAEEMPEAAKLPESALEKRTWAGHLAAWMGKSPKDASETPKRTIYTPPKKDTLSKPIVDFFSTRNIKALSTGNIVPIQESAQNIAEAFKAVFIPLSVSFLQWLEVQGDATQKGSIASYVFHTSTNVLAKIPAISSDAAQGKISQVAKKVIESVDGAGISPKPNPAE